MRGETMDAEFRFRDDPRFGGLIHFPTLEEARAGQNKITVKIFSVDPRYNSRIRRLFYRLENWIWDMLRKVKTQNKKKMIFSNIQ